MKEFFRELPSMDICLKKVAIEDAELFQKTPRLLLKEAINTFFDLIRLQIKDGHYVDNTMFNLEYIYPKMLSFIKSSTQAKFCKVLNGTGIIIHTNMGRSVLAQEALEAICNVCNSYSNLELALETGTRGSRYSHIMDLLCLLTGAESAVVVNNNAAAVLITLNTLCKGKEVIVSRGQLVEIGGSFRIPDVMEHSGALLHEVGCTNRVHYKDYENAMNDNTAAIMRVHTSNYRVIGFHSDVSLQELVALGKKYNAVVIEDLGSGSFFDFSEYGLPGEPTIQTVVASGVDVVTFSGDKVLGGPQAGIILGKKAVIEKIASNPLNRVLRIDKMTLAALEATLRLYLNKDIAFKSIPTLAMMTMKFNVLIERAEHLATELKNTCRDMAEIYIQKGYSQVGGGSFPEHNLPTSLVFIKPYKHTPEALKKALLKTDPPLIGRLEDQAFCIDPRTIINDDVKFIANVIFQAFHALSI